MVDPTQGLDELRSQGSASNWEVPLGPTLEMTQLNNFLLNVTPLMIQHPAK